MATAATYFYKVSSSSDVLKEPGPYLDIIDPPTNGELGGIPSGKKLFHSFDYGDMHFISLNSELGSLTPAYNWIGILDNSSNFTSPMLDQPQGRSGNVIQQCHG